MLPRCPFMLQPSLAQATFIVMDRAKGISSFPSWSAQWLPRQHQLFSRAISSLHWGKLKRTLRSLHCAQWGSHNCKSPDLTQLQRYYFDTHIQQVQFWFSFFVVVFLAAKWPLLHFPLGSCYTTGHDFSDLWLHLHKSFHKNSCHHGQMDGHFRKAWL